MSEKAKETIRMITTELAKRSIIFDQVDYNRSVMKTFEEVDKFKTVDDAINEMAMSAWEEPAEYLHKTMSIIRDREGNVLAVGTYQPCEFSAMPKLVWHFTAANSRPREQFYEIEYAEHLKRREAAANG